MALNTALFCFSNLLLAAFATATFVPGIRSNGGPAAQDELKYSVNNSIAGYAKLSPFGVSVEHGSTAEQKYSTTVTAIITSQQLDNASKTFTKLLTEQEWPYYENLTSDYNGGLDIPFLRWLGINLHSETTKETMDYAASRQPNYAERSAQALKILKRARRRAVDQFVEVAGSFTVTGTSFIPIEAFVYTKMARVILPDGSLLNVISSSGSDTMIATASCTALHNSHVQQTVKVSPRDGSGGVGAARAIPFSCRSSAVLF